MATLAKDSTGDSWKELAERSKAYEGAFNATVDHMIRRMNSEYPFSTATGVFDNGCGSGSIMSRIIDQYGIQIPSSARLLAGDFSDHMLAAFRETKQSHTQKKGDAWDRLELRNIDAHDLSSIPDESLSHVTGGMMYFLLPDANKALRETYRVLCPGGVIATSNGKMSQHIDALNKAVEKVKPGTNLDLLSGVWTSEAGVKSELAAAGFVDVETELIASEVTIKSREQFAETLLQMPVMKKVTCELSGDEQQRLQGIVVDELRAINPREPGTLSGVSIVAVARRSTSPKGILV